MDYTYLEFKYDSLLLNIRFENWKHPINRVDSSWDTRKRIGEGEVL